ncbi:MAG: DNA polymerase III subunit delta [bacterium]|nr:DNA polymerase III subunit delta [bacterium]
MLKEYQKFITKIKENKIEPGYLLLGENEFIKDEIIALIHSKLIDPRFEATDKLVVYGEDFQIDIISWLLVPPFGSKKKLLIIKNADLLPQNVRKALQQWLDKPSKTAVVILMSEKVEFEHVMRLKCWKLFENEIPGWIKSLTKERGFDIEYEAIEFLQQIFCVDLYSLATEIAKIMNFIEPRRTISLSDVQELESHELTGSIFDLIHAIGEKKSEVAYRTLKLLFELGEEPTKIVWHIRTHFDKLLKLKEQPDESFGIHKHFLPRYKEQTKLWSNEDLLNVFSYLFETDLAIKTGKADPQLLLHELIYKLSQNTMQ